MIASLKRAARRLVNAGTKESVPVSPLLYRYNLPAQTELTLRATLSALQTLLLPAYLWLFLGTTELVALPAIRLLDVFGTFILLPLLAAWAMERWAERRPVGGRLTRAMGAWPVPLLALVVLLIALGQGGALGSMLTGLPAVAAVFVCYLIGAMALAVALGRWLRLQPASARALASALERAIPSSCCPLPWPSRQGGRSWRW